MTVTDSAGDWGGGGNNIPVIPGRKNVKKKSSTINGYIKNAD
jgi:hypothetical protein